MRHPVEIDAELHPTPHKFPHHAILTPAETIPRVSQARWAAATQDSMQIASVCITNAYFRFRSSNLPGPARCSDSVEDGDGMADLLQLSADFQGFLDGI